MTAISLAPAWVDDDLGYSEFYQRYSRPLTCYLKMGFRDADVEAVAQETFCRALAHWAEVRNMTSPWPWLAVTARNLARNNIRDEQASRPAGLDVFPATTCSREDVAEQVEASESLRRLAEAMAVLTPLQKRLVTVMVEEGLTGAQLARRLDMRPGAVRMHLCRMRLRLGERFAALGGILGVAPAALLGVLRRFRGKSQAIAGSTPLTLSTMVVAVGVGVIGVLPAVPFLPNGNAASPHAVAAPLVTNVAAVSASRTHAAAHVTRHVAVAPHAASRQVVASTAPVNVAGEVRTGGSVTVDKRGTGETPTDMVERCLRNLTVSAYYVSCEDTGTGTQ
jgi:RNA polymerase sigma-70 factor (ECF subfamily)